VALPDALGPLPVLPARWRNAELDAGRLPALASLVRWHCVSRGRVQGVNYRARVAEAAHRYGVVGTVANRPDGTVFIDVQGPVEAVEAFLRDVSGPRGVSPAHTVERVAGAAVSPDLVEFEIRRA
jgi:acylphosphatase